MAQIRRSVRESTAKAHPSCWRGPWLCGQHLVPSASAKIFRLSVQQVVHLVRWGIQDMLYKQLDSRHTQPQSASHAESCSGVALQVLCKTVRQWITKNTAESENLNWILANTKPCPKCHRPIEKNQVSRTCCRCRHHILIRSAPELHSSCNNIGGVHN